MIRSSNPSGGCRRKPFPLVQHSTNHRMGAGPVGVEASEVRHPSAHGSSKYGRIPSFSFPPRCPSPSVPANDLPGIPTPVRTRP